MPAAEPLVLFAPASRPGVGGGHVMRCLTLAEALAARGARCVFTLTPEGEAMLARFAGRPFETIPFAQEPLAAISARLRPDVLILDDYSTTFEQEAALQARRLVVIDDLADRRHPADLLLDPGYGRLESDYDGLLPERAQRLVGPSYALVRSAFAVLREEALARPVAERPRRLFVSFGLSDVDGIAGRAVRLAQRALPDAEIDIALAASAISLPDLQSMAKGDAGLHLHVDATDVARLMANADLALGAGGASTWERACLGLPTLAVVVADNQRAGVAALARDDALLAIELADDRFETAFPAALQRLESPALRRTLRTTSAALCDGLGAERAAAAILALVA